MDESMLREWLVGIGRRSAERRVAHLLCELVTRFQAIGMGLDNRLHVRLTQADLADATGLTGIHMNRVVQRLRRRGLVSWSHRELWVLDMDGLKALASFDANYLHLREPFANDPDDYDRRSLEDELAPAGDLDQAIGAAIAKHRAAAGISLADLAAGAGCDPVTMARYEAGVVRIRAATLMRIASALGRPTSDLLSAR